MSKAMKFLDKIERLRPLIPVQIYQHFVGLSTLYARMGVRLMLNVKKGSKIIEWYSDEDGGYDFSVSGLINYSNSQSINLPDPENGGESYITIAKWIELLEAKQVEIIYQFVNGSLSRQFEIHSAIRGLIEKQSNTSQNI